MLEKDSSPSQIDLLFLLRSLALFGLALLGKVSAMGSLVGLDVFELPFLVSNRVQLFALRASMCGALRLGHKRVLPKKGVENHKTNDDDFLPRPLTASHVSRDR